MTVAENWGGPNLLKNYLYKSKSWEKTQVICNKSPPPPPPSVVDPCLSN